MLAYTFVWDRLPENVSYSERLLVAVKLKAINLRAAHSGTEKTKTPRFISSHPEKFLSLPCLFLPSLPSLFMKVKVKVAQSCMTICNPMDYTVHGILQDRILEWVAYPFSRGSSWPRSQTGVSCTAGGFFTSWATREHTCYGLNSVHTEFIELSANVQCDCTWRQRF